MLTGCNIFQCQSTKTEVSRFHRNLQIGDLVKSICFPMKLHLRWLEGCLGIHCLARLCGNACRVSLGTNLNIWISIAHKGFKKYRPICKLIYKCRHLELITQPNLQRLPTIGEALRRSRSRTRARSPPEEHQRRGAHRWTSRKRLQSIRAAGEGP